MGKKDQGMQRAGIREQARGVRAWLRVMGAACLVTAAVASLALVSFYELLPHALRTHPSYVFDLSVLASGVVALFALASLSLAMARSLRIAGEAGRQATEDGAGVEGEAAGATDAAQTATLRTWLMAIGLLCLLPPVVLVVHTGLAGTSVHARYTYWLGAIGFALVTIACLSFGFAKALAEYSRVGAALRAPASRTWDERGESETSARGIARWSRQDVLIEKWLAAMSVFCLSAAAVAGCCVLMVSIWFYGAFPRWNLVAFALGAGLIFGLVALSSLSWAGVRLLRMLHEAAEAASVPPPGHGRWAATVPLYLAGVLCLAVALPIVRSKSDVLYYYLYAAHVVTIASWVVALLTLAALSFAVARSQYWLSLVAAGSDRLSLVSREYQPEAGKGGVNGAPSPVRVPADQAVSRVRPSAHSRWRRRILIAAGVVAVMVTADPDFRLALRSQGAHLASFLGLDGRYENALTVWTQIALLSPAEAHAGRAYTLSQLGRYEEALAALDKAIAFDSDKADFHYSRAVTLMRLGRYEEALAALDSAIPLYSEEIALDPTLAISQGPYLARAHNGRAWIYHEFGRYEEALAAYDAAIALNSDKAEFHQNRARTLMVLGRYEEALAASDRAIALDPENAWSRYGRAQIHALQGRRDAARDDLSAAIELDPELRETARSDEILAGLDTASDLSE
jgi:Flp pilus assembly protein TadD